MAARSRSTKPVRVRNVRSAPAAVVVAVEASAATAGHAASAILAIDLTVDSGAGSAQAGPAHFCFCVKTPGPLGLQTSFNPAEKTLENRMEQHIELEGRILTVLAGTMFRVELDNKHQVLATISGKMRKRFIRLTPGDRVKMEMSPYDLNKARIVYRLG